MRRDYYEDVQLLRSPAARFWFGALLIALCVAPWILPGYTVYTLNFMAVKILAVLGLTMLTGYTGQISLGHAGFMAIGAYATVLLIVHLGVPFPGALLLAGLLAALFGFVLGFPALRLEGPYLAVVTLGFGLAVTQVIGRWPVFGGRMGLVVPPLSLGPLDSSGDRALYYVIVPVTFVLALAARNLMQSRVGRAFRAIRDSDIAAQTLGVNLTVYKTLSFAISAFYAGIAGGLLAFVLGFINPEQFTFVLSVLLLAGATVGGLGAILGAVLGGALISILILQAHLVHELPVLGALLEQLSRRVLTVSGLPNAAWVATGLVLILVVLFEPLGLYGLWLRTKRYWRSWPF